jgi:hypothetical protein
METTIRTTLNDDSQDIALDFVTHLRSLKADFERGSSCGNPGGSSKTLFGKEFDNVCITTFRFDNPNADEAKCVKKLAEIRIKDIMNSL